MVMVHYSRIATNYAELCRDVGQFTDANCLIHALSSLYFLEVTLFVAALNCPVCLSLPKATLDFFARFALSIASQGLFSFFTLPIAPPSIFACFTPSIFCITLFALTTQFVLCPRITTKLIQSFHLLALRTSFRLFHLNLTNRTAPSKFAICCLDSWHLLRASS